jgi:predicted nucleic acid-binding protein
MKKLLIDTNIIIDLLSRRENFYTEAATLFSLADKNVIKLSVLSLTFANTNYTLIKEKKPNEAKTILRKLRLLVDVLPLDDKIIGLALNDDSFTDFEDALQYFSAIENNQDNIITRNLKDFKKSKIPVMTARQFIETLE